MGYTLYLDRQMEQENIKNLDLIIEQANNLYNKLLKNIYYKGQNLYDIFILGDKTNLFDECFHEYGMNEDGKPIIINSVNGRFIFCKTARKIYDIAVFICYNYLEKTGNYIFSGDFTYKILLNGLNNLEKYASLELNDDYHYDFEKLNSIYNTYIENLD